MVVICCQELIALAPWCAGETEHRFFERRWPDGDGASLSVELPPKTSLPLREAFVCPYCDAALSVTALSCRSCGRDLTAVLPLLRRLDEVEMRLTAIETREEARQSTPSALAAEPGATADANGSDNGSEDVAPAVPPVGRRRFGALALGLAMLLAAHATVVIWLDLPLALLRLASIAIPFGVGVIYLSFRPRLTWFDTGVAALFAIVAVGAMNALLGWVDSSPMVPLGASAWRETFFYVLSIGASFVCGMLLRVTQVALSARGLTSLPRLRDTVMATNGKVPMDTLKAIELTILLVSTIISAITGLLAGLLGVTR
jgi:hypothetical protein